MADESVIERVRLANDIVEVVSQALPLRRAGRHFKALCPFHKEKTPSFSVNVDRQIFHCFGCGEGGDVFAFVMKTENMSFPEALEELAARKHIEIPRKAGAGRAQGGMTKDLYHAFERAHQFFVERFGSPEGEEARAYLRKRGFSDAVVAQFAVGFAPDTRMRLFETLSKQGIRQEVLLRAGLVVQTADKRTVDMFHGRVVFPIRNAQGRVVAFGGRVMGQGEPKYLNSPESDLFRKRRELFGLPEARRSLGRDATFLIVVEGYLDCIRLHEAGFTNSVATLGTALTEEHATILHRYVPEVVLVFDGDSAGMNAALRGLPVLLEEGLHVRLVALPEGNDPDDLIRERGGEAFGKLLADAEDFVDFQYRVLANRFGPQEGAGLVRLTAEFVETLSHVANPVLVDRALAKLAARLKVEESSLRLELKRRRERAKPARAQEHPLVKKAQPTAELFAIALALEDEACLVRLVERASPEDFATPQGRKLFLKVREFFCETGRPVPAAVLLREAPDSGLAGFLESGVVGAIEEDVRRSALEDCLRSLAAARQGQVLDVLMGRLKQASGTDASLLETMKEYQEELIKLKGKPKGSYEKDTRGSVQTSRA